MIYWKSIFLNLFSFFTEWSFDRNIKSKSNASPIIILDQGFQYFLFWCGPTQILHLDTVRQIKEAACTVSETVIGQQIVRREGLVGQIHY